MKNLFLGLAMCLVVPFTASSQNKSLSVGTTTPNPNAALHVESPTNNQGIIIPRLSTVQRSGITPTLGAGDVGLIIFDTDLRALAIWNGSAWDLGSKVGAPINIANTEATGNAAVLENSNASNASPALVVNTAGGGNAITANAPIVSQHAGPSVSSGVFINQNAANPNAALYAQTIGTGPVVSALSLGSNSAAIFEVNNAANGSPGINVSTNGTGAAGSFTINNAGNTSSALAVTTDGTGFAGEFRTTNTAHNTATLGAESNSNTSGSAAIGGRMIGTGGPAGYFQINNAANNFSAVTGVTNGTSGGGYFQNTNAANAFSTLSSLTNGTGPAGYFQNTNAANTNSTLYSTTNGTGNAIAIRGDITDAANTAAAVYGSTVGSGVGLYGISTGTGAAIQGYTTTAPTAIYGQRDGASNGNAGVFSITNAANTFSSLIGTTIGAGPAGSFQINNTANNSPALTTTTNGNGSAASFTITQGTSTAPALNISHAGTGNAITANRPIQATQFIGDGSLLTGIGGGLTLPFTGSSAAAGNTFSVTNSATSGSAGDFSNTGSNTSPTLNVANSGNGSGVNIQQNTIGTALNITSTAGSSSPSISVNNAGAGASMSITQSNAGSSPVITINNTGGAGNAITANRPIQATQFIGDGSLLTNLPGGFALPYSNSTSTGSSAFSITNTGGTHGAASFFSSSASTATLETQSSAASAFQASNTGTAGSAGEFLVINGGNPGNAVYGINAGTGKAGEFAISNVANSNNVILASTNGTGIGVNIALTNAGNTNPALSINHGGTGNAITANRPIQASSFVGDGSTLTGVLPSGIIMPFAGSVTPAGYLVCDGSAVSRTTYAALFSAIGTNWGVGDGSTTFNLPDLRGRFMRGVDGAAGNDPDAASRTAINGGNAGNNVGSYQDSKMPDHIHYQTSQFTNGFVTGNGFKYSEVDSVVPNNTVETGVPLNMVGESRPKNAYVNYIIKF